MKLSEVEAALAALRQQYGDVEVNEAMPEYGFIPFTVESFASFVRFETTTYPNDDRPDKIDFVMGRHAHT